MRQEDGRRQQRSCPSEWDSVRNPASRSHVDPGGRHESYRVESREEADGRGRLQWERQELLHGQCVLEAGQGGTHKRRHEAILTRVTCRGGEKRQRVERQESSSVHEPPDCVCVCVCVCLVCVCSDVQLHCAAACCLFQILLFTPHNFTPVVLHSTAGLLLVLLLYRCGESSPLLLIGSKILYFSQAVCS